MGHRWQALPLPKAQFAEAGSDALVQAPEAGFVNEPACRGRRCGGGRVCVTRGRTSTLPSPISHRPTALHPLYLRAGDGVVDTDARPCRLHTSRLQADAAARGRDRLRKDERDLLACSFSPGSSGGEGHD